MRETVLVTGALGFLGRAICHFFGEQGWRVIGVDLLPAPEDLPVGFAAYHAMALPSPAFETIVAEYQPRVCVHGAGCASVGMSMNDPAADYRGNTLLVFEVLDALRRNAADCRFLLLSSAAVYGDPASLPVTETHPVRPLSPYGYHKRQAELVCEEFTAIYGVPTAATRIFSAYGLGLRRQVVWDICERVLTTGKLKLHGTGTESRDFIHAADIARGLHCVATNAPCAGEVYNLATGRELTISELAARLLGALDCSVLPEFDGAATPGNPRNWRADISRIAALGFQPAISLEQGLGEVATWCREELTNSGALVS